MTVRIIYVEPGDVIKICVAKSPDGKKLAQAYKKIPSRSAGRCMLVGVFNTGTLSFTKGMVPALAITDGRGDLIQYL